MCSAGATMPTDNASLGETARASEPFMRQVFIGAQPEADRRHGVRAQALRHPQARGERHPLPGKVTGGDWFYVSSLSCKTLVYKGMLLTEQVDEYYPDLRTRRWRRRWRWCIRVSAPTRSRAGTARIRTATSRTTAKSTPCAATSTGCTPRQAHVRVRPVRRRHQEDPAGHQHRRQRLGDVRQLPGIARHGGPRRCRTR